MEFTLSLTSSRLQIHLEMGGRVSSSKTAGDCPAGIVLVPQTEDRKNFAS